MRKSWRIVEEGEVPLISLLVEELQSKAIGFGALFLAVSRINEDITIYALEIVQPSSLLPQSPSIRDIIERDLHFELS